MRLSILTLGATLLILPIAGMARAEDQPQIDCSNGGNSTVEMQYCAEQDYNKADKQLNAVYKQALKTEADLDAQAASKAQAGAVASLKAAQRIWIQYRDAHCDTVGYEAQGGTILGQLLLTCKAGMTNDRIKALKGLIKGLGE